jgi:hypothetical protein
VMIAILFWNASTRRGYHADLPDEAPPSMCW